MEDGNWPVLHNTAMGLPGGYEDWLLDCLLAVRWACEQPDVLGDRLSFFGTSQGGGGSLLMASLLGARVRCVCADLPFLTAFPIAKLQGEGLWHSSKIGEPCAEAGLLEPFGLCGYRLSYAQAACARYAFQRRQGRSMPTRNNRLSF